MSSSLDSPEKGVPAPPDNKTYRGPFLPESRPASEYGAEGRTEAGACPEALHPLVTLYPPFPSFFSLPPPSFSFFVLPPPLFLTLLLSPSFLLSSPSSLPPPLPHSHYVASTVRFAIWVLQRHPPPPPPLSSTYKVLCDSLSLGRR